jgi:hypothetical protein
MRLRKCAAFAIRPALVLVLHGLFIGAHPGFEPGRILGEAFGRKAFGFHCIAEPVLLCELPQFVGIADCGGQIVVTRGLGSRP